MTSKYDTDVDLSNKNSSHTLIVDLVGRGKRVLDVGASTGYLARTLVGRGCSVVGIELDPDAARRAEEFCERVVVGNVEELDLDAELGGETFDAIVFGDVLEHLKDPQRALERFAPFVDPGGGRVVASIPNIAHGSVRLALLRGEFRYRRLGLLDDTHLRFFTRESVEEMFGAAGFLISEVRRTRQDVFDTEIEVDGEIPGEVLRLVRSDPEAFTYQFVLTAHPLAGAGTAEALVHELTGKLRGMEDLRQLLDLRDRQLAEREREVARLTQEVSDLSGRLAKLVQQGKADA